MSDRYCYAERHYADCCAAIYIGSLGSATTDRNRNAQLASAGVFADDKSLM